MVNSLLKGLKILPFFDAIQYLTLDTISGFRFYCPSPVDVDSCAGTLLGDIIWLARSKILLNVSLTLGIFLSTSDPPKEKSVCAKRIDVTMAHTIAMASVIYREIKKTALRLSASGFFRRFSKYWSIVPKQQARARPRLHPCLRGLFS